MSEHVYVVARAGRCNGVTLAVYLDALSAIALARRTAESQRWTEQEQPTNQGQLYMAHGEGDEDWIEVQQRPIERSQTGAWSSMFMLNSESGSPRLAGGR